MEVEANLHTKASAGLPASHRTDANGHCSKAVAEERTLALNDAQVTTDACTS